MKEKKDKRCSGQRGGAISNFVHGSLVLFNAIGVITLVIGANCGYKLLFTIQECAKHFSVQLD